MFFICLPASLKSLRAKSAATEKKKTCRQYTQAGGREEDIGVGLQLGHHGFQLLSCPLLVLLGWVWSRWTPWFFIRNSSAGNACFTTCRAVSCGCENLTSVVRWIHWIFSALEEVNLFFTLMVSSTVMVDIVFACFIYGTFYWRWRNSTTIYFSSSLSTVSARRT